jgi:3-isopropylmalate dehydrogenase
MKSSFEITVLPGDGIGVDVTREAVRVLEAVMTALPSLQLTFREVAVGAAEYLRHGDPLPETAFAACRQADAVLLGAMGLPDVRWPDGKEMTPQIDLRERLELYAGLRPIYLFHAHDSPLKHSEEGSINFLLVRENTEGLFAARLNATRPSENEAQDTMTITRRGSERVCRTAFRHAMQRRRKVTLVDKANVLPSMVFFREIFDEVATEFPEVETERVYVDAAALYLVQRPESFDVIVTENMFGDILSDLAAGLVGGMGMAPSGDVGDAHAVFQPSHGTAPDIAGKGIANPIATILSASMMLEWLGTATTRKGARMIEEAVRSTLSDPQHRTPDCGGRLTTSQLSDRIIDSLSPA